MPATKSDGSRKNNGKGPKVPLPAGYLPPGRSTPPVGVGPAAGTPPLHPPGSSGSSAAVHVQTADDKVDTTAVESLKAVVEDLHRRLQAQESAYGTLNERNEQNIVTMKELQTLVEASRQAEQRRDRFPAPTATPSSEDSHPGDPSVRRTDARQAT